MTLFNTSDNTYMLTFYGAVALIIAGAFGFLYGAIYMNSTTDKEKSNKYTVIGLSVLAFIIGCAIVYMEPLLKTLVNFQNKKELQVPLLRNDSLNTPQIKIFNDGATAPSYNTGYQPPSFVPAAKIDPTDLYGLGGGFMSKWK